MTYPAAQVDWTFNGLWPYQPRYISTPEGRCACVDEGPRSAHAVLLLHGNPTWSFLWRHAIKALVSAGQRVIAPDLLGFGRSDKPDNLAAQNRLHPPLRTQSCSVAAWRVSRSPKRASPQFPHKAIAAAAFPTGRRPRSKRQNK